MLKAAAFGRRGAGCGRPQAAVVAVASGDARAALRQGAHYATRAWTASSDRLARLDHELVLAGRERAIVRPHLDRAAGSSQNRAASLGWRVLPLGARSKTPALKGWPELATTDPAVVLDWFSQGGPFADCQVGIATGRESGVWVLDIDARKTNGFSTLISRYGITERPETFIVRTPSGGEHWWWRYPADGREISTRAAKLGSRYGLGPGLDTRGYHGQVVAPYSAGYEVSRNAWPIPAPRWLEDLAERKPYQSNGTAIGAPAVLAGDRPRSKRPPPNSPRNASPAEIRRSTMPRSRSADWPRTACSTATRHGGHCGTRVPPTGCSTKTASASAKRVSTPAFPLDGRKRWELDDRHDHPRGGTGQRTGCAYRASVWWRRSGVFTASTVVNAAFSAAGTRSPRSARPR
jgi:bifunctional DNA primase/polymerase-like protein